MLYQVRQKRVTSEEREVLIAAYSAEEAKKKARDGGGNAGPWKEMGVIEFDSIDAKPVWDQEEGSPMQAIESALQIFQDNIIKRLSQLKEQGPYVSSKEIDNLMSAIIKRG